MNEQDTTKQACSEALTENELAQVVGGTEGPGSPTDGTGAR
jgi:bacteriocin-like protein